MVNTLIFSGLSLAVGAFASITTVVGAGLTLVFISGIIWGADRKFDFEKTLIEKVLEVFE